MVFKKKRRKEDDDEDLWIEDDLEDFDTMFTRDMEEMMRRMQEEIDRLFPGLLRTLTAEQDKIMKSMKTGHGKPIVYGFSIRMGPEGVRIDDFGNVKPEEQKISKEREPLVDVIQEKKGLKVVAELPGVDKKNIKVSLRGKQDLSIRVAGKFYKKIRLPKPVKRDYKMRYKNGVLELDFKYA